MDRLENAVQTYAWGSRRALAELRGEEPSGRPEAELWMGAHPSAPSRTTRDGRTLDERIASAPEVELGRRALEVFGPRLPFLFKVLAAEQPLSLQAHPSLARAREGFEQEEHAGIPRDAPHRNYRDPNHKPELICALSPFVALCGFRAVDATRAMLAALAEQGAPGVHELGTRLDDLAGAFRWLMTLERARREALVRQTVDACGRVTDPAFAAECAWVARIGARYPGDPGVVGALLLNLVQLAPGEAIYLPAGNLHAYLSGVGVELMASSDNVLRGGLTPKHVDVSELLAVLDFRAGPVEKITPTRIGDREVWGTPAREFELSRVRLEQSAATVEVHGPVIALCTIGRVTLTDGQGSEELTRGQSVFVRGSTPSLVLRGEGVVHLASCAGHALASAEVTQTRTDRGPHR